ncbi:ABC transporter permease [Pseudonocardia sp. CA-107938]|uniref:ABC transporter permease n=1 Tax=Pseudonocardia sp. CA-107938 TaxID=3240021 RepID=UPI003D92C096
MLKLLGKRLLTAIPLFFGVTFIVFWLISLNPATAATSLAGDQATPDQIAALNVQLGLDRPLWDRYWGWLSNISHGDFGNAITLGFQPVTDVLLSRVAVTISLVVGAIVLSVVVGMALGIAAAMRPTSLVDRAVLGVSVLGISLPQFWIGLLLVVWLSVQLGWLPAVGYTPITEGVLPWASHILLPVIALSIQPACEIARQLRGSLVDVLSSDYILAARARGTPTLPLVCKHALKNAAAPVATITGFRLAQLPGTAVVVEGVFALNGLGSVVTRAALTSDTAVVLGVVVLTLVFVLIVNLLVDLSYGYLNPRVRT